MLAGDEPAPSTTNYASAKYSEQMTIFKDSITAECTPTFDCHDQLTLSVELDNCDACANNNCVLSGCTDFVALNQAHTFTEQGATGSGQYKFQIDNGIQVLKNHYARIKGVHPGTSQTVYSEPFILYTNAHA